jgi:hypothetical protein
MTRKKKRWNSGTLYQNIKMKQLNEKQMRDGT